MDRCVGGGLFFPLPFFINDVLGKLTHKATADIFINHGSWAIRVADMLIGCMVMLVVVMRAVFWFVMRFEFSMMMMDRHFSVCQPCLEVVHQGGGLAASPMSSSIRSAKVLITAG